VVPVINGSGVKLWPMFGISCIHATNLINSGSFSVASPLVGRRGGGVHECGRWLMDELGTATAAKNFHIYIHGRRDLIEKGTDESGKKFYKIYFEEEH